MRLYWFRNEANFGDALNPLIAASLMPEGGKIRYSRPSRCDSVFIGSTLGMFLNRLGVRGLRAWARKALRPAVHVWGTGLLALDDDTIKDRRGNPVGFIRRMKFHAVRGRHTKAFVEKLTGEKFPGLALGDPGLLASMLVGAVEKKWSVGVIPHYVEYDDPSAVSEYNRILDATPGSRLIDVRGEPMAVLRELSGCRTILSTAMHGLIVADSLHIPNARCVPRNPVGRGDFKFADYYSVYKSYRGACLTWSELSAVADLEEKIKSLYDADANEIESVKASLAAAFPREWRKECVDTWRK